MSGGKRQGDSGSGELRPQPRHQLTIEIKNVDDVTGYILSYAGQVRTVVYEAFKNNADSLEELDMTVPYYICQADEIEGSARDLPHSWFKIAQEVTINGVDFNKCIDVKGGNPTVILDERFIDMGTLNVLDLSALSKETDVIVINEGNTKGGDLILTKPFNDTVCSTFPDPLNNDHRSSFLSYIAAKYPMWGPPSRFNPDPPVFAKLPDGGWALHDYRLLLEENSLEKPLMDGGGAAVIASVFTENELSVIPYRDLNAWWAEPGVYGYQSAVKCTNAPPTIFNQNYCKMSYEENVCTGNDENIFVTLDEEALKYLQLNVTGKLQFRVDGLVFDESLTPPPCRNRSRSRWLLIDTSQCINQTNDVGNGTRNSFAVLLYNSIDTNPYFRDILYNEDDHNDMKCDEVDINSYGFTVYVEKEGNCFRNIHPDLMSIYDMSTSYSGTIDWKEPGLLDYSAAMAGSSPQLDKWETERGKGNFKYVGRYGDVKSVRDVTQDMIYHLDKWIGTGSTNDKRKRAREAATIAYKPIAERLGKLKFSKHIENSRGGGTLVCGSPGEIAPDPMEDDFFDIVNARLDTYNHFSNQKKTIWTDIALSSPDQLRQRMAWSIIQIINLHGSLTASSATEANLYWYDIFVRNAFGNYLDILREVAYNIKMGEMLTFVRSRSVRFAYDIWGRVEFPDENFARELMQLYTIGVVELNMDGTPKLDKHGQMIQTYETKDIMTFARAWTGFDYSRRRGNVEEIDHEGSSRMDPMALDVISRDWFPKENLGGGYIGDREPLCYDLPDHAFLRQGAKYQLLGGSSSPRWQFDMPDWKKRLDAKRVVLTSGKSNLYDLLCNASDGPGGSDCNFASTVTLNNTMACYGVECEVDTLRVVQVGPGVFYEYVRKPCVQLAFFEGAKKVFGRPHGQYSMCAHPKMPVAGQSCCDSNSLSTQDCQYLGELVTYARNENRCNAIEKSVCDTTRTSCGDCCGKYINKDWPQYNEFYWTDATCSFQVKVRIDGFAAIVHNPGKTIFKVMQYVSEDKNQNFISLPWPKDEHTGDVDFPSIDNQCGKGACTEMEDQTCLCDTTTLETVVFSIMPTRKQVLAELRIGAFEPELFDSGTYDVVDQHGTGSDLVVAYFRSGKNEFSIDTIFKVLDEYYDTIYLKNVKSIVQIGGEYDILNPVHYIDLVEPTVRDAHFETEAVIKYLVRHDNTPPYISKQLIQRFGISNPSPRYVESVARAFSDGYYEWERGGEKLQYGDRKWGNLAATAAAILLDREATSVSLDADPIHGSLREPLLKVIGFMRSLEYTPTAADKNENTKLHGLEGKIGQMVYSAPDQFSFFRPDNSPAGTLSEALLVSPEAQLLTMSQTVKTLTGFFSLARSGLNELYGGFGISLFGGSSNRLYNGELIKAGDYEKSVGYLSFSTTTADASSVIDELAMLLTSGRLSNSSRALLTEAYSDYSGKYSSENLLRLMQQLIATAPEFHSNNLDKKIGHKREPNPPQGDSNANYKAVVFLFLFGGLDSFNVLVPDPGCDLYDEYKDVRGSVHLSHNEIKKIDASGQGQPCDFFGVHNKIPLFEQLYTSGEGIFLANTGHLHKPVTKKTYARETTTSLFSHNTMEQEAYVIDAYKEKDGTGVLGRMLDMMESKNFSVGSIAMDGDSVVLAGATDRFTDVIPAHGPVIIQRQRFSGWGNDLNDIKSYIEELNSESKVNSGLFANHWSQNLVNTWAKSDDLKSVLDGATLKKAFTGGLGTNFKTISKLIVTHAIRKKTRESFYVRLGGFDAHTGAKSNLDQKLPEVNSALTSFYLEMKEQDLLDSVTVVVGSEFGRTLSQNSGGGTDHAWGGNYFMFGGQVNGSRILGAFPESFAENDPTNIGRGRLIPTTPWDALWHGISQWFGVTEDEKLDYVLPNRNNFACKLFTDKDLYLGGTNSISGCGGNEVQFDIKLFLNEPRYLTGIEQKRICAAAILSATNITGSAAKCIIVDQKIIVSYERRLLNHEMDVVSTTFEEHLNIGDVRRLGGLGNITSVSVVATTKVTYGETSNNSTLSLKPREMQNVLQRDINTKIEEGIVENATKVDVEAKTSAPTSEPSSMPSDSPSNSQVPSTVPSDAPSDVPSSEPSYIPSHSQVPSDVPSSEPSDISSLVPSGVSIEIPTFRPSASKSPSNGPSKVESDEPSVAPLFSPTVCKPWCSRNTSPLENRCSWEKCEGCGDCEGINICRSRCSDYTSKWKKKCSWKKCGGCKECEGINICETRCSGHTSSWETKCSWDNCYGCRNCEGITCRAWCNRHSASWGDKCNWIRCSGCESC